MPTAQTPPQVTPSDTRRRDSATPSGEYSEDKEEIFQFHFDERYDEFDGSGLDPVAKQKALDQFQAKMNKTKEQIKEEQNSRDENVDEYLRLSSCADRHQLSRIKQVFEKKNQKSAQNIAQLQKKLESYQRKVYETKEQK